MDFIYTSCVIFAPIAGAEVFLFTARNPDLHEHVKISFYVLGAGAIIFTLIHVFCTRSENSILCATMCASTASMLLALCAYFKKGD